MKRLHWFEGFGVELEYMIVDRDSLQVRPLCDELLKRVTGTYTGDFENGAVTWSNELVLHVVELKCTQPEKDLVALEQHFANNIKRINELLHDWNAMLMPTAAHPLMDPMHETKLWPHDNNEVYEIYNRLFDCRGHGWSNLQSTHLNLPFASDEEFGRLHAAIRVLLPILPALCASSPLLEGKPPGKKDMRLTFYKTNQERIPIITGAIVPEPVFSEKDHDEVILQPIATAIRPYNTDDILDPVWVNSRGAMSRFDRGSIEIRIMDIQECPGADLAIVTLITELLRDMVSNPEWDQDAIRHASTDRLSKLLEDCVANGLQTHVADLEYLALFGYASPLRAGEIWNDLFARLRNRTPGLQHCDHALQFILQHGNLSERIINKLQNNISPSRIISLYRDLSDCLANNRLYQM